MVLRINPVIRRASACAPAKLAGPLYRGFASDSRDISKAREILNQGFERMKSEKNYKKSPQELKKLVDAGKELGVSADYVKQVYESIAIGVEAPRNNGQLTAEQKAQIVKEDTERFAIPARGNFGRAFEYDDLPSAGHIQLEEHRGQRHMVRIAAWELPQLTKYRSEYRRPSEKNNLQFRYYTFLGEDHPAARKVVLTFRPETTGLDGAALHKLKVLAGPRYDIFKNEIKIASNRFPEQAQNKRYLGHIYSRLLQAAKDASDSFADVPLDPRPSLRRKAHHKSLYPEHKFPTEWNRPDMAPKPREDIVSVLSRSDF